MDVGFLPKVLLKICVKAEELQRATDAIVKAARTGDVGDGKIFIYPIARFLKHDNYPSPPHFPSAVSEVSARQCNQGDRHCHASTESSGQASAASSFSRRLGRRNGGVDQR
jgi:hypothetical protein